MVIRAEKETHSAQKKKNNKGIFIAKAQRKTRNPDLSAASKFLSGKDSWH
jgi:hypothetical protein